MNDGAFLSNIKCMYLGLFSIVCIKLTALRFIFCHLSCNWIRHHSLWHLNLSAFSMQIIFQRRAFHAIETLSIQWHDGLCNTISTKMTSEYDQEMAQSHVADQPKGHREEETQNNNIPFEGN